MAENLVVVESPAKAKTINKFLGKNFLVKASMGHIKDLPKSKLGVDLEKNFEPHYITIRTRSKLLKELKSLAKKAKHVYLATDPDREGEAIGWHLAAELKAKSNVVHRILFHEITKKAVQGALKEPRDLDMNLVNAQQARRILDRLVGYSLSPLLWKNVRRGLSAGRVQSVAVRLVVEREEEIAAFKPEEYWELSIELGASGGTFSAELASIDGQKLETLDQATAQRLAAQLPQGAYKVASLAKKEQRRNPQAPFTTSTLQQESARKLHFSAKKTMLVAQQLYEGLELGSEGAVGLITYMRTDSVRVAEEAQVEAKQLILDRFGKDYAPANFNFYKTKKQGQDAHEAVRPTSSLRDPKSIAAFLSPEQLKLYRLIWTRFVASQMTPAVFDQTSVEVDATLDSKPGAAAFRANGSIMKFPGYLAAWNSEETAAPAASAAADNDDDKAEKDKDKERQLPPLSEGEALAYVSSLPSQHFTQPPPRFNDATLVKMLEELEIGRPSTYAPILSTIQDRGYVERMEGGRYKPTELGVLITQLLVKHFQDVLNVKFTAGLERELDRVEEGDIEWQKAVASFFDPFQKSLGQASEQMRNVKKELEVATEVKCSNCGTQMVVKWGRHGKFLACPNYPTCRNTKPMEEGPDGRITEKVEEELKETCEKCGKPMIYKQGRFGRFIACSGYPDCKNTRAIKQTIGVKCPKCNEGDVVMKRSRKGRSFYGCSAYPKCDFVSWGKPVLKPCPKCQAKFLTEKYSKKDGMSLVCITEDCGYKEESGTAAAGASSSPAGS
jgi:DNA topoisomerase-1